MYLQPSKEAEEKESSEYNWWNYFRVDTDFCRFPGKYIEDVYRAGRTQLSFRFWVDYVSGFHSYQIFNQNGAKCNTRNLSDYELSVICLLNRAIRFAKLSMARAVQISITDKYMLEAVFTKGFTDIVAQSDEYFSAIKRLN